MCAPASANYRVGLSEQDARVFSQPAWQALKLKRVRYIVSWDYYKDPAQVQQAAAFLNAAHAAKQDVLVMFTAHRGCYVNGKYSKAERLQGAVERARTRRRSRRSARRIRG